MGVSLNLTDAKYVLYNTYIIYIVLLKHVNF